MPPETDGYGSRSAPKPGPDSFEHKRTRRGFKIARHVETQGRVAHLDPTSSAAIISSEWTRGCGCTLSPVAHDRTANPVGVRAGSWQTSTLTQWSELLRMPDAQGLTLWTATTSSAIPAITSDLTPVPAPQPLVVSLSTSKSNVSSTPPFYSRSHVHSCRET